MHASDMRRGGVLTACDPHNEEQDNTHTHEWSTEYSYDDEYHYYECTVEGCDQHTGTEPHEFDDDQDATCNKCDYTRHVHPLEWKYDGENHWQEYKCEHHADEQLNKGRHVWGDDGKCKECLVDKSTFHTHNYEWKYDDKQHWEMTTCTEHASEMSSNGKSDHVFQSGKCECGLEEIYITVYNLYKSNSEYKGESKIDDFATWYASLEDQHVDHVGLNSVGDAVFYASEDDTTGEVKYYAPRTYTVKAVTNGTPPKGIENVYFSVKATVDGQPKQIAGGKAALDVKATDEDGSAQLTFTPVWGYSSATVVYTVNIASEGEYQGPSAIPVNYICNDSGKSLTVSAAAPPALSATFTLTQCLAAGEGGQIENRSFGSTGTTFVLADSVKASPGWYLVTVTTTQGAITTSYDNSTGNTMLSVDGGESGLDPKIIQQGDIDRGGAEAQWLVYIKSDTKNIRIGRRVDATIICNIKIEKVETSIEEYETKVGRINKSATNEADWYKFDISNFTAGKYYIFGGYYSVPSTETAYEILVKIGNKEAVPLYSQTLYEIGEGDETVAFCSEHNYTVTIRDMRFVPCNAVPETGEFDIEFDELKDVFYYSYTAANSGTYSFKLSSAHAFSNVSVSYGNNSSTIIRSDSQEVTEIAGNFVCEAENDYVFAIKNNSKTDAPSLHCTVNEESSQKFNVGEEFGIAFNDSNLPHYYVGTFTKGVYVALLTATNLNGVTMQKDNRNFITVNSDVAYASAIFEADNDTQDINFTVTLSDNDSYPTVKALFVKVDDDPTEASENEEFTINFADKKIVAYQFTYTESTSKYFGVVASSDNDIKDLAIYGAIYKTVDGDVYTTRTIAGPSASETKSVCESVYSSSFGSSYKKAILVFVYGGADAPSVTAKYKEQLHIGTAITKSYSSAGVVKVDISTLKSNGADKYTLYEAYSKDRFTHPDYSEYHAVATGYVNDSAPAYYQNLTMLDKVCLWYYVYCEDTTGNKLPTRSDTLNVEVNARKVYTVTANFDENWQGWIGFSLYKGTSAQAMNFVNVTEPTKTVEVKIAALATSTGLSVKLAEIKDYDNDYYKFTFPEEGTTTAKEFGDADAVTIEATSSARQAVEVTVTVPENFAESSFPVTLYHDGTLNSGKTVKVEPGKTVYNVTLYAPKPQSGKDTIKIYTDPNNGTNGYTSDEVDVVYADGKATAAIAIKDHVQLKLKLKFPENFLASEFESNPDLSYTFSIYIYGQDGKTQVNVVKSGPSNNPERLVIDKAFVEQLKSNDYVYEFTSALYYMQNGNYSVEITTSGFTSTGYGTADKLSFSTTTTTTEVEMNAVKDRILITVNVEAYETFGGSAQVQVFKGDGNGKTSGSALKLNGSNSAITTVPLVKEGSLMKGSFTFYIYEGQYTQVLVGLTGKSEADWSLTPVEIDGKTGTATLKIEKKYVIAVKSQYKGPNGTSVALSVYKNGVQMEGLTANLSSMQPNPTIYLPIAEYDKNAKYEIKGIASPSNYECKTVSFTFDEATKTATVNYDIAATIKIKFELPADADSFAGTNDKKVDVYLNEASKPNLTKLSLDLATTTEGSFNYLYTESFTVTCVGQQTALSGNPMFGDPDYLSTASTKYLAEASYSWNEDKTECTVTIKPKRAEYEITVKGTLPQEFIDSVSASGTPLKIWLYNERNSKKASCPLNITSDAKPAFESKIYAWELEEGYTAKIDLGNLKGFTVEVGELTVDAEAKTGVLNITVKAQKKYTIKIVNNAGEFWSGYSNSNKGCKIWIKYYTDDNKRWPDSTAFAYKGTDPTDVYYFENDDTLVFEVEKITEYFTSTNQENIKATVSIDKESGIVTITIDPVSA